MTGVQTCALPIYDGGYWAGNAGTRMEAPTLTFTPTGGSAGENILYNPQWAVNGTYASNSGPAGWWNSTKTWGGNTHPQLANVGATLGDYAAYTSTGGTTSGTSGGYSSLVNSLCCGGSSASFSASQTNVNKVTTFANRGTNDSQVYIEQIGNGNIIDVTQEGTKQNYLNYHGNGNSNDVTISQSGNNSTQSNYIDLSISGNSNNVDLTQSSTGGGKGIFASIGDNNNTVAVTQSGAGSHYLNLTLSGGNKTVDVTQSGSASHMADINLSGAGARSLNLTQQGSTQQFYSISSTCASSCQAITVTQGQ